MSKQSPWEYEDDNIILFWSGILSNWFKSSFTIDGITYSSAEQHMMAEKARAFGDLNAETLIMATHNPREQKMIGRKIKNFDEHIWTDLCLAYVLPGIKAKFAQNPSLASMLLATGNKVIAEASPYDKVWGIGLAPDDPDAQDETKWNGKNYLGELLMIVRQELREK